MKFQWISLSAIALCLVIALFASLIVPSDQFKVAKKGAGDSENLDPIDRLLFRKPKTNFRNYVFEKVAAAPADKINRLRTGKNRRDNDDEDDDNLDDDNDDDRDLRDDRDDDDDEEDEDEEEEREIKEKKSKKKNKKKGKDKKKKNKKQQSAEENDDDDDDDNDDVRDDNDDDEEDEKELERAKKSKKKDKKKKKDQSAEENDDDDDKKARKKHSKKRQSDDDDDNNVSIEEDSTPAKKSKKNNKQKKQSNAAKKDDDDEDQKFVPSLWNFYGFFAKDDDDDNGDEAKEKGFLETILKKREEENKEIEKENKGQKEEIVENGKSWISYLNRKPFNLIYDFGDDDDGDEGDDSKSDQKKEEEHDTEPDKPTKEEVRQKKRSGPLNVDEFEEMLGYIPSFVPNYTNIDNLDCRRQGQIFHRQLRGQKLWAFQMIDAGGKIGSSILQGNINQLGNFDLCTAISTKIKLSEESSLRVKGKYCLAHFDIHATDDSLKYLIHLIHGKSLLRSTINDPSHFVPRFTTFNWGVCVPAACKVDDVQEFLEDSLEDYNATGVRVNVEVDEDNCHTAQKFSVEKLIKNNHPLVAILACFSFILVIVVLSTMNECWTNWQQAKIFIEILDGQNGNGDEGKGDDEMVSFSGNDATAKESFGLANQLLLKFSLKNTFQHLTTLSENEIGCIHGLKALASLGIFLILKVLQLIRAPYSNRVDLTELLNSPVTILLRSPLLYMDLFLFISGFLSTLPLIRNLDESGKMRFIPKFLGRLSRLLPILAISVFFQAHIWPHLGSGPQWHEIVETHSELCEENWWRNLLFVQNFDKIEESCDPINYQSAVDMHLFLITPLIVWLIYKIPIAGLGVFGGISAISVAMRFSETQTNRLAPVFYHGIKMTQIYRTMNFSFGSMIHRATPYFGGIGLAFMVLQFGPNVKIPKAIKITTWLTSLIGVGWCLFSQTNVTQRDYVYDGLEMAKNAAWTPIIWTFCFSWIVFACYTNNGEFVNRILSAKPMIFFSRISYSMHFVQYIVLYTISALTRDVSHFEISHFINVFEIFTIISVSTILTLLFDIPMKEIRKLLSEVDLFNTSPEPMKKDSEDEKSSAKEDEQEAMKNGKITFWQTSNSLDKSSSMDPHPIEDLKDHVEEVDEEVEEEEEEEEEEERHSSGGNRMKEEVHNIWGSDSE